MFHGEINATILVYRYDPNYVSILTVPDEKAERLLNKVMCVEYEELLMSCECSINLSSVILDKLTLISWVSAMVESGAPEASPSSE